jgi:hypothetical protein
MSDFDKLARSNASRGTKLKAANARIAELEASNRTLATDLDRVTTERDQLAAKPKPAPIDPPADDQAEEEKSAKEAGGGGDFRDDIKPTASGGYRI